MSGSTVIAIVSVTASALTAIGVPLVNGSLEMRREERKRLGEQATKDFDRLRDLLDECASSIEDAIAAIFDLGDAQAMASDRGRSAKLIDPVETAGPRLLAGHRRLTILLGREHPVTLAFFEALVALDKARSETLSWVSAGPRPTLGAALGARHQQQELRDAFLDAATALVGSPFATVPPRP